jgi:hypothetical protein
VKRVIESLKWGNVIQPLVGSVDFSLETSLEFGKYWQPHWHLPMRTDDPDWPKKRLIRLFSTICTVWLSDNLIETDDLNFLPYVYKVLKINPA